MRRIEEVYIGVFTLRDNDIACETILNGIHHRDDGGVEIRASIEHELTAVPGLIMFCDHAENLPAKNILNDFLGNFDVDENQGKDDFREIINDFLTEGIIKRRDKNEKG